MRGNPFGYLRDGSYAYVRFALENPTLYRLMFTPPPKLGVSDDPWSSETGSQIFNLFLTGLRCSQEEALARGAAQLALVGIGSSTALFCESGG